MSNPYVEAKNMTELCRLLGLTKSHAAKLEIRRDLIVAIRHKIKQKGWTQVQAAAKADVGRTVITAIVNGNISRISTDKLIEIADRLGLSLELKVA